MKEFGFSIIRSVPVSHTILFRRYRAVLKKMAFPVPPVRVMFLSEVRSKSFENPEPTTFGVLS